MHLLQVHTIFVLYYVLDPEICIPLRRLIAYISVSVLTILNSSFSGLPTINNRTLAANIIVSDPAKDISEKAALLYNRLNHTTRTNVTPATPTVNATNAPVDGGRQLHRQARHPELLHQRFQDEPFRGEPRGERQSRQRRANRSLNLFPPTVIDE